MERKAQSAHIPIKIAIGPAAGQIASTTKHIPTRNANILVVDMIMVNRISPAARKPLAGAKEKEYSEPTDAIAHTAV